MFFCTYGFVVVVLLLSLCISFGGSATLLIDRLMEAKQHVALAALYDDPEFPTTLITPEEIRLEYDCPSVCA